MKTVVLGLPCYQTFEFDMVGSVVDLMQAWPGQLLLRDEPYKLVVIPCRAQPVQLTRNRIAEAAEQCGADMILWQDSDIVVSPAQAIRLVQTLIDAPDDVALVAAPCVLQESRGDLKTNVWPEDRPTSSTQPFEVGAAGFGFVAMRMSALKAIEKPWFRFEVEKDKLVGEDLGICLRLRQAGMKLLCDPRVTPDHVFRRSFGYSRDLSLIQKLSR